MSTEFDDTRPSVRTVERRTRRSHPLKVLLAVALLAAAAVNLASMLPLSPPTGAGLLPGPEADETASTLTFKAEADARVEERAPSATNGESDYLEAVSVPGGSVESYLRFTVSGIPGGVQNARLLVYSTTDESEDGPALYAVQGEWSESEIAWENRPPRSGEELGDQEFTRRYSWVEYDVTSVVTGDGTYSFVLAADSDDGLRFSSRESSNDPRLVITFAAGTPTSAATATSEGGDSLTFAPDADVGVARSAPGANQGAAPELHAGAEQASYIRFDVSGIAAPVQAATLRLFCTDCAAQDGPAVHFAESQWSEAGAGGMTWETRPPLLSGPLNSEQALKPNSWVEYDVTAVVTGDGTYTFALVGEGPEAAVFSSREGAQSPRLIVRLGLEAAATATASPAALEPLPAGAAVLVGAGDIATCERDQDEQTARLLDAIPGTVFAVGDNAYKNGTAAEYAECYDPSWGQHKARTKPVPGNHEYNTEGAAGYFEYFADIPEYYAYDLGEWRIYALNSEIDASESSAQVAWLQEDLAANPRQCVLAYWHRPRWSSGSNNGSNPDLQALWQIFYEAGAELVINGHEHNYERFAEMDESGRPVPGGLRQIIVGTGGAGLYPFGAPLTASEVRDDTAFGVLKVTLLPVGYEWEFVPVPGSEFSDSGSGTCR